MLLTRLFMLFTYILVVRLLLIYVIFIRFLPPRRGAHDSGARMRVADIMLRFMPCDTIRCAYAR